MSKTRTAQERVIRVFVSSTFLDMQAERDELVLIIFPQLRRLCEERGVTWGEIDLRWGITEEQSQRGEVLPICLEEIRRCRPYFIGVLGERYGWIPDAIPAQVLKDEPWILEHADTDGTDQSRKKSVTELEILHGVLNNPEMADHSYFYFRDPAYLDRLSADQKKEDFVSENDESHEKLNRLKDDIRQMYREKKLKYEPREDYRDAKALGQLVLDDFTKLIDTLYPKGTEPSPLQRERMDHDAFAQSRAGVYIGRQEYFDRLDAHVAGNASPLVVLGESGGGKSALLSNWALQYREQHPDHFLLIHFIGASPNSANAIGLLRRIMLELKERFDLPEDIPAQADKIRDEFPNWLANVATRGPIVLVLDALNQLEDVDAAPDLGWLPRVFPKNCRVIVSTLPGRSLTAIEQRGWLQSTPPLYVHPLDEPERRELIHRFLKQFTKSLNEDAAGLVAHAPQTSNPLYLRVLLNELRVFGQHEKLNDEINRYLEAKDPRELYGKVIARWEKTYSEGINLVRDTLSLIWAARRGLSETELLEALGQPGNPLPRAIWSPLLLAVSDALVTRSGLLTFAHDFLRSATRDAFLRNESLEEAARRQLAEYFQRQSSWSNRKLDELPWQLASAGEKQQLHDTLTEEECFLKLNERAPYELLGYWCGLKPKFDVACSYTTAFASWAQQRSDSSSLSYIANQLADFLHDKAACHAAAEPLLRHALAVDEESCGAEHPRVAIHLNNLAALLKDTNRLAEAEALMRRALAINEQSHGAEHHHVAICLNNLAQLLMETNRLAEAEPLIRRALAIDERLYGAEHPNVAVHLNSLGGLLKTTNRLAEAEPLMRRALSIKERFYGDEHPIVASEIRNLTGLLCITNRLSEAEPLVRRALAIDEQCYGIEHPNVATSLNNLATLLSETNRLTEAEQLMRRTLAIDEQAYGFMHSSVARDLGNLAVLLKVASRLAEAEPLMRRALAIDEQCYGTEHPNVATCLNNLAQLLSETNRLAEAEPLMRRALAIDEKSYGVEHPDVARDLDNLAAFLMKMNRLTEAEPMMRRALAIDEKSYGVEHPSVANRLNNLAQLLSETNRLVEAEPLIRRALAIDEKSYGAEHPNVANRLCNLSGLLVETNRVAEAEPLMRRALAIDEHSYGAEHPYVARDLNNLAQLFQQTNRLTEAEPLMRRAVNILENATGEPYPNYAGAIKNLAWVLMVSGRLTEAEPMMRQALAIDEQTFGTDHPHIATDLRYLTSLLYEAGRLTEAEPLMRRALAIDEQSYGVEHPDVANDLSNLAGLLMQTNRPVEAEPLMRRALSINERTYGADHPDVANNLNSLSMLLKATYRLSEAEPLMRRALAIKERSYGPNHPTVAVSLSNLGELLRLLGQWTEAESLIRHALEIDTAVFGQCHPYTAIDEYKLAMVEYGKQNTAEARDLLSHALIVLRASYGDDSHHHIQETLSRMQEIGMDPS